MGCLVCPALLRVTFFSSILSLSIKKKKFHSSFFAKWIVIMEVATPFPGHNPCTKLYLMEKQETMELEALKFRMKDFSFCLGILGLKVYHSAPQFTCFSWSLLSYWWPDKSWWWEWLNFKMQALGIPCDYMVQPQADEASQICTWQMKQLRLEKLGAAKDHRVEEGLGPWMSGS